MLKSLIIASVVAVATIGPAAAQSPPSFDPLGPCATYLDEKGPISPIAIGFWAFGFLDAGTGASHEVTAERLDTLLRVFRSECAKAPETRMFDLAAKFVESQTKKEPGAADAGRALLMRFFDPAEDHGALTLSLKPSAEDVRAVYAEPLASALIKNYEQLFVPGAAIRPKPEQTQLLSTFTTTGRLKARDPALGDFPGGYEDVLDYFVSDVPIGRFKFVEEGETLGLAFDGLIFVNDHWVFMPKPWQPLSQ
ncbi:MAG: hypothetical protein KDJ88_17940 [Bauldia sp.]|nr:hypothetical protein [Bauldia sp.]